MNPEQRSEVVPLIHSQVEQLTQDSQGIEGAQTLKGVIPVNTFENNKEDQAGCMVSVTFLDDTHVMYSAIDKPIQRDGFTKDCSGHHGARGQFFNSEAHVKDGRRALPTLVDLGFTTQDEITFRKLAGDQGISVEDYIGTTYQISVNDNNNEYKEVNAERKLFDKEYPQALMYAIESTNIYNGDSACGDFGASGGMCFYGIFMKNGAYYYVMTGENGNLIDESTGKVFTYTTTDISMAKKLPESFKKELERLGLKEENVNFASIKN